MKRRIKIQGFLLFLTMVITILLATFLFPHWKEENIDEFLDVVGIGFVLFGFLFRISARGYKAEKSSDGKRLIEEGPYSLIRHPMYFGTFLIGIGVVLVLFKWWVFVLFFLAFLFIYIPQIQREEKILFGFFGDAYKDYCKITPKYFPNIFSLFKINPKDYLSFRWPWVKKELHSLVITIGVIITTEMSEDIKLFGYGELKKELLELFLIVASFITIFFILFYKKGSIPRKY